MVSSQPGFLISDKKNLRARKRGWYKYPIGNSILHFNKINEYLSARIWSRDSLILQISGKTFDILYGVPEHWGFKVQNCKGKIRLSKKPMLMPIQSTFTWNVFNQPKGLISLWQGKRSKINIKWKFYSSVNLQIEIWIESNICERSETMQWFEWETYIIHITVLRVSSALCHPVQGRMTDSQE